MWKRKVSSNTALLVILTLILLSGCGLFLTPTQQEALSKLTPDQTARLLADGFQSQLEKDFDSCKLYVDSSANPATKEMWKNDLVPAFDKANKMLATIIAGGGLVSGTTAGNMTPDEVQKKMQPLINDVIKELLRIGFKR